MTDHTRCYTVTGERDSVERIESLEDLHKRIDKIWADNEDSRTYSASLSPKYGERDWSKNALFLIEDVLYFQMADKDEWTKWKKAIGDYVVNQYWYKYAK